MRPLRSLLFPLVFGVTGAEARDVPDNLRNFYNAVRDRGKCSNALATGFWATDNSDNSQQPET